MALPNSNISTTLVGQTLGSGSRDVGTLCTHPNINKWSKWKPVRSNKVAGLTESDIISANAGLDRNVQTQVIAYRKPRGGAQSEFYRLGDFRNYNHNALPPVNVEIISVQHLPSGTYLTPPYQLTESQSYIISFKLTPGDIDPLWINSTTSRIKNTDAEGGYGGVTWVLEHSGPGYEYSRDPEEVFSATVLDPPVMVQAVVAKIVTDGLRLEYVRYEGSLTNKYKTMNTFIEDDGFSSSYRSLFSVNPLTAGINFDSNFTLFWNSLANRLEVRIPMINNEAFPLNVKLRLTYKRVETSQEYNYNGSTFELAASSTPIQFIPLSGWSTGTNTYEIRAWMYVVRPDSSEVEISYRMQTTAPITITTGD